MATKYTDPLYDSLDAEVTAKLGLPDGLLTAIRTRGERSNADQVSSAGAKTVYQVIPQTRDAVVKKYGIDPYESPQAAAMAAGYLLKESLQRNNGDVTAAVREYHGGTNRKNWGPVNDAYANRVVSGMNPYANIKLPSLGGDGGGGGEPARLTIAQKLTKYNAGKMSGDELAQFESALVAGDIVLPDGKMPKSIAVKQLRAVADQKRQDAIEKKAEADRLTTAAQPADYTGNRMQQFTDQAGDALSNAGRTIAGDGIVDAATAVPRAIVGGAQALITGGVGMGVDSFAGLTGLLAGGAGYLQGKDFIETATGQIDYTRQALQPIIPQPVVAPNTANAMLEVLAVPALGTQAAGQASYDEHGNPLAAAALQGLGDTAMAGIGFRGVGKAAAVRPEPVPVPRTEPPAPRPQPAPAEPLPTNPADLAAQAEAMPRPDVAPRPNAAGRVELTPDNPDITIRPDGTRDTSAPKPTDAAPTPQARTPQGKAFTTDNTPVDFVYDVVPVESIQKSLNADMTQNKAARTDLQPRNRDTDASTAQVNEISNNLNPNRLLESPTFDTGAPAILGAEAVAGHGRLTAIERRYMSGRGADYKAAVVAKAQELGIDPAKFEGIDNPVLVRRLPDDATAVKVASDSNASTTLQMSVAEQARTDAKSLPDASKLVIGEKGEINIAGSTDFVREFMRSMPTAARGDLMRPDGTLSQAGVRRIQSAIAQKAYSDATMLERVSESLDDQGKRISAALVRNAGALVALADDVKAGARVENTLAPDLAMAANKYADIKASGSSVGEYMAQGRLVDDGMTAGALEALQVFGDNARSGKAVSEYIQGKIKEIEDKGNPSQETLFQTAKEQKEADAVRRQYEGTAEWMQAPDGTPTKLSEQQWVQVRTPSFKEWFGDWEGNPKGASKVVDENGEPRVVYHGTSGDHHVYDPSYAGEMSHSDGQAHGIWLSLSRSYAGEYALNTAEKRGGDWRIDELFVSAKDVLIADFNDSGKLTLDSMSLEDFIDDRGLRVDAEDVIDNYEVWKIAKQTGFKDGIFWKNGSFTDDASVVVPRSEQIKSATENSGRFDPDEPSIYMQGNKPASQVIADTIAKQVADTGKFDADYAAAAGELAAAYYKATAAAIGKTSKEVFDAVPLDVKAGEVRDGAKAQISFGEKQHSMVLGPTADASGFIHELGHHFLETHAKLAEDSPVLKADLDAIMEWGGHKGRKFDDLKAAQKTELHEKFAETFEQYLLTGKAPTAKLKAVFDRFKTWMESVYDSLVSFGETNPRAKLSDDIVGVLDNMLGNKADARANAAKEAKRTKKSDGELLDFKRSAPADGGVSPAQHQSRYNVLREIGLTEGQIRGGVVTGDAKRMGWDTLLAKADTEAGRKMKQQMELESDKLREYGDAIVESTGGTLRADPEVRGSAILKPLEEYRDIYKAQIKEYYAAADQKAKSTGGIELTGFQAKLRENSFFSRDAMRSLRKGIASWMREQDLVGTDGHFRPMSGKQAESLRQYINSQYDYSIAGGIRVLNDLIDDAVFKTLGENMYADARALNAKYHRIFTDPKGISVLLDSDGINRKVSPEKVGTKLAALAEVDVAQFQHIVDQLEVLAPIKGEKPTALQADAMRAIGEIRAQIAEKITTFDSTKPDSLAGTARAYAPFRGEKLDAIFGKDTAAKLRNYVAARGVLRHVDPNPSGSASSLRNFAMRATETTTSGAGAGAGAFVAGGAGAMIGGVIGQQIGKRLQNRIIEAADQKSYDKAMSPTQLQNMRQSMGARGRRLGESQPVQDAVKLSMAGRLKGAAAKAMNARILKSAEWKAYYAGLGDADKAKIKQSGAVVWLSSLGADDQQ